jgi:hypothetical protein
LGIAQVHAERGQNHILGVWYHQKLATDACNICSSTVRTTSAIRRKEFRTRAVDCTWQLEAGSQSRNQAVVAVTRKLAVSLHRIIRTPLRCSCMSLDDAFRCDDTVFQRLRIGFGLQNWARNGSMDSLEPRPAPGLLPELLFKSANRNTVESNVRHESSTTKTVIKNNDLYT